MKNFRDFTDDLQRFDWWIGKLIFCLIEIGSGTGLWMEWVSKTIGITAIISGIAVLIWPFISKHFKRAPKYISFKEATKIIADCSYYDFNGQDKINESEGVTRESYYKQLLSIRIRRKEISLYGRKIYSSNPKVQKIDNNEFKKLYLEMDCNFLSTPAYSQIRENVYTDLRFKKNELNLLAGKLKREISA